MGRVRAGGHPSLIDTTYERSLTQKALVFYADVDQSIDQIQIMNKHSRYKRHRIDTYHSCVCVCVCVRIVNDMLSASLSLFFHNPNPLTP